MQLEPNLNMCDEGEDSVSMSNTPDLDYDMWEGQFEFVGPGELIQPPRGLLTPAPHLSPSVNGVRKNAAHAWCEEISDQVNNFNLLFKFYKELHN